MDTSIPLKRCSRKDKCINPLGSWLPATIEYYPRRKSTRDGLAYTCKVCHCAEHRRYVIGHLDKIREYSRRHYAEHTEYYRRYRAEHAEHRRRYQRRYHTEHTEYYRAGRAEELREYQRNYRATHKDEMRRYRVEYPEKVREYSHRRRARKANATGTHTAADVRLQVRSQTDKRGRLWCWLCGKVIKDGYHVDHRIPLSRGGSNGAENIVIAHAKCNLHKGAKTPQEMGRLL